MGHRQVAVIDPGPDVDTHVRALVSTLDAAREVSILLTHSHGDHAGAAPGLAGETGARILAPASYHPPPGASVEVQSLREGDRVSTDQGELVVLEVPGHTRDHLAFHWVRADALFVGDLLLGRGNTTWIGEYPGCVGDYLRSLERVRDSGAGVLFPGHGPPITNVPKAVERFRRHRLERLEEVRVARLRHPGSDPGELTRIIYGEDVPPKLMKAARASVEAALAHLDAG